MDTHPHKASDQESQENVPTLMYGGERAFKKLAHSDEDTWKDGKVPGTGWVDMGHRLRSNKLPLPKKLI